MKTWNDLANQFKMELDQWFIKQCRNNFESYFLYYLESTPEHDGGLIICADSRPPANKEYKLACPENIRRDMTKEQNFNHFTGILRRLPVLSA